METVEKRGFRKLFRPAWQSDSAARRLAAIPRMDGQDPKHREALAQLARDSDDAVSLAAIERMEDLPALLQVAAVTSAAARRSSVRKQIRKVMEALGDSGSETGIALLKDAPDAAVELAICAPFEVVRSRALDLVQAEHWLTIIESTEHSDVRQRVVKQLDSIDLMLNVRKLIRGRDKAAERLLKDRMDAIRAEEREREALAAEASRIIEKAEYLAANPDVPDYSNRVDAVRRDWMGIEQRVDRAARDRYALLSKAMIERSEQLLRIEGIQRERAALLEDIASMIEAIRVKDLDASIESGSEIESTLDSHVAAWDALAEQHAAEESEARQHALMVAAMRSASKFNALAADPDTCEQALQQLRWPAQLGEFLPAQALIAKMEQARQAQLDEIHRQQRILDRLHKQISTVVRLSQAGRLSPAHGLYKKLEQQIEAYQGKERESLIERLHAAREALEKMDDWKSFATEPKYQQLCEAMEQLVDSPLHPDALSAKIKALNQQWKALGRSINSDDYWARFKTASDAAYQPCAEFFAQRKALRCRHLEQREGVVERMRALLDEDNWGERPDYPAIEQQVREISREFQDIKDVEQAAGQAQWKRFKDIRSEVQARLEPEYDRNHDRQQQLIASMTALADALAEAPAESDGLDKLQSLQKRWKQIGITRRKDDQKAWKAFKQQGDRAYDNLQAMRKQKHAAIDAAIDGYRELVRSIEKLAHGSKELAQIDRQFELLQEQYAALPTLPAETPDKLRRSIEHDYRKACARIEDARKGIVLGQRRGQLEALRQKAALCAELEALKEDASERVTFERKWDEIELTDPELAERIESRRQAALASRDLDAIAQKRRLFCIQAEIGMNVPSPPEDRQLRMQYQLDQINQHGLGGANQFDASSSPEHLEIEWLCMPGADPATQAQLDARLRRCLSLPG